MKKIIVAIVLLFAIPAYASGMPSAAVSVLFKTIMHYAFTWWPAILPLFYLAKSRDKVKLYLLFLTVAFGVRALYEQLAWSISIAFVGKLQTADNFSATITWSKQLVALVVCIWFFQYFRKQMYSGNT